VSDALKLLAALGLVLGTGFFVAAEFALARSRLVRLDQAAETRKSAALAGKQARQIDRYLAACQLGITTSSLGLGWLGEPAFSSLLRPLLHKMGMGEHGAAPVTAGIIAFAIITVLHVVVGELAPKSLAIQKPEATATFRTVLSPVIALLNGAGIRLVRLFGIEPAGEHDMASTPEDIQRIIAQSEEGGRLDPEEADMLEGVFELHETLARDVMTPRPDVTTLNATEPVREALERALAGRHSRFPVVDGDHTVVGVVQLSQLARALLDRGDGAKVGDFMGDALFVPESQPIDLLLRQLQSKRASLSVVLDEYGDLAGVVTIEDIVEEIVGEIDDERDRAQAVTVSPDGRLMVGGHVPLESLGDHGVEIEDESVTSVGGLIFGQLGRLPRTGDSILVDGYRLSVEATRGTRVLLVAIEREPAATPATPGEAEAGDATSGS
jgi:CBS domain containing-hemolysin-like protein